MVKYKISIGAIFKCETPFLLEWIEYHRIIGVEHFFLYCDDDDPIEAKTLLQPYVDTGIVTWELWHTFKKKIIQQVPVYDDMLKKYGHLTEWLAIIDIDEFILLLEDKSLSEFLINYEQNHIGGIGIHSVHYGSSDLIERPELQIEGFVRRSKTIFKRTRTYKSIIRPDKVRKTYSSHLFAYKKNFIAVNELLKPMPSYNCVRDRTGKKLWKPKEKDISCLKIRINHYILRCFNDFWQFKAKRRHQGQIHAETNNTYKEYWEVHNYNNITDTTIHKYIPKLRERLKNAHSGIVE